MRAYNSPCEVLSPLRLRQMTSLFHPISSTVLSAAFVFTAFPPAGARLDSVTVPVEVCPE